MRVLVTGSRSFLARHEVNTLLYAAKAEAIRRGEDLVVVHGAAPGADTLANDWCWDHRNDAVPPINEPHPAEWNRHGKVAGFIRNFEMVMTHPDYVFAFFAVGAANNGTRDCVKKARQFLPDVPVKEVWA